MFFKKKSILNKIFQKVFVITSYATQDRLERLVPYLEKLHIDYELIISPKKKYLSEFDSYTVGEQSLVSGYESVFLYAKTKNIKTFCVLEDDIVFVEDFERKIKKLFQDLPKDWNIINLGYTSHNTFSTSNSIVEKISSKTTVFTTHFTAYNNINEVMIEKLEQCTNTIDLFYLWFVYKNFNSYVAKEKIAFQSSFRQNGNKNTEEENKYILYYSELR